MIKTYCRSEFVFEKWLGLVCFVHNQPFLGFAHFGYCSFKLLNYYFKN